MRKIVQLIFLAGLLLLPILTLGETGLEPLSLSIKLENDTVDVSLGESVIANVTAKGGTPPYTYDFDWYVDVLDDNNLRDWVDYVRDATIPNASFMPPYGERGEVYAVVYDTTGEWADAQASFVITEAPERLICDVVLDDDSVQAGQPITATLSISGGSPPFQTKVTWFINESNGNIEYFNTEVTNNKTTFIPLIGVSCQVTVEVSDSKGQTASEMDWFEVTGAPEPLICTIKLDKEEVNVGQPITATWLIQGGIAPYSVNCFWDITESNDNTEYYEEDETDGQASFIPLIGVSGQFRISVTDTNGTEIWPSPSAEFTITGALAPLELGLILSSNTVNAGDEVTVTAQANGGEPPYRYRYRWSVFEEQPGWTAPIKTEETTSIQSSFRPPFGLGGDVMVEVTDNQGLDLYTFANFSIIGGELLSQKVTDIADECMSSVSGAYARAKWLHDYLIMNADYDYTYTNYSPYGVLMLGTGVCQSYATAYQLLLNKVGVSNKLVSAEANNGSGWDGHAWNLVNIGGNWYHVDVTWDDGWGYKYFLKSDKSMSADHRWDASKYPACPYDWGKAPELKAMPGDATNDGTVDILDLVSIIDYIVSNTSPASQANADANGDGTVDILDLVWIIDQIVGG